MPPHITAATGMDALTHAVEAYICLQKNPLSDVHATAAITLIRENLLKAVKDGKDSEARLAMANAACLAGAAFSNSMVGIVHSLGHATGAVCHVPHGLAMSIFLPHCLEYNMVKCSANIAELLLPLAGPEEYVRTSSSERATRTVDVIRRFQKELYGLCKLPMTLKDAGVPKDKLGQIARTAINDGSVTMNPVEMDFDDALSILKKAYE